LRLDKILAHSGYGSRKEVKKFIRKGYCMVNGVTVYNDDFKVDPVNDEIILADQTVNYSEKVYFMLNKPSGVVSATFDNNYETVIDILNDYKKQGIFPVGRLDIDTEGLLLITNDGVLAHSLLSPKKHVDKEYYVEFDGEFLDEYYLEFEKGIELEDDFTTLPAKVINLDKNKCNIIIHEGKFHQVKRMFKALGMEVTFLSRVRFKNLLIDKSLELGQFRKLTEEELEDLRNEDREN